MASKHLMFWQIYEVRMILMILKMSFDFSSITSIVRWKDIETAEKHSKNQIIQIHKAKKSTSIDKYPTEKFVPQKNSS